MMHPPCMEHLGENRYRCRFEGFIVSSTVLPIRCSCPEKNTRIRQLEDNRDRKHSAGLGDTIARMTKLTRLDELAEGIAREAGLEDCGCEKRREYLNKLFPYRQKGQHHDG